MPPRARRARRAGPLAAALAAALAALQLGATDCGEAARDGGFDLWCGDALCAWTVERGAIRRAPTWHAADLGVELVGDDVALAQLAPVTSADAACLRVTVLAHVDAAAEVRVEVDVLADGRAELDARVPAGDFRPVTFELGVAGPYDGARVRVLKAGPGRVVLGGLAVRAARGCAGAVDPGPRPDGASCDADAQCASARCLPGAGGVTPGGGACAGCDPRAAPGDAGACAAGATCDLGAPTLPVFALPLACVPAGGLALGERCLTGAACASGRCNAAGACSACDDRGGCPPGQACGPAAWPPTSDGGVRRAPSVCAPGQGLGAAGQPCAADADCASGGCAGATRRACDDGRPCGDDRDCPVGGDGLRPGACVVVGVQGGACR